MKRIILVSALLLCALSVACFAAQRYFVDEIGYFTAEEADELEAYLADKSADVSTDIVMLFKSSTGGDFDAAEEAEAAKDGYRDNLVIFFLSDEDKLYDTIRLGIPKEIVSTEGASAVTDAAMELMRAGDFLGGAKLFADEWAKAVKGDEDAVALGASARLPSDEEDKTYEIANGADGQFVVDGANLLCEEDYIDLSNYAEEISEKLGISIAIVTTKSIGNSYPRAFADDYYDSHGYGPEGVLLLISMADRDWYITTTGEHTRGVLDRKIDSMGEHMIDAGLSSGDYHAAFRRYIKDVNTYFNYSKYGSPMNAVIAVVLGLIVGLITRGVLKAQLKSVKQKTEANEYVTEGSMKLEKSEDVFLYKNVTKTERQSSSSSGGGSRGGGGGSHGGGGGKF
ncbi:MAG: TPM domain-containing protein [Clostridia bacterium]|nr:TPM domain-containing protein [Clostridia bacterium]